MVVLNCPCIGLLGMPIEFVQLGLAALTGGVPRGWSGTSVRHTPVGEQLPVGVRTRAAAILKALNKGFPTRHRTRRSEEGEKFSDVPSVLRAVYQRIYRPEDR